MKITAISGDMAVKLAIGAGAVLVLYLISRKVGQGLSSAADVADKVVTAINPTDPNNLAYSGVNVLGGALVRADDGAGKNADGSWTLGGWLYDVTHPTTANQVKKVTDPAINMPTPESPSAYAVGYGA